MPKALVLAPRRPTSSCTVLTDQRATRGRRRATSKSVSTTTNAPIRSSNPRDDTRSPSKYCRLTFSVAGSETRTLCLAAWASRAPMSMNMSSMRGAALRSSSVIRWMALRPMTPGTGPFAPWMMTCWPATTLGSNPPMVWK